MQKYSGFLAMIATTLIWGNFLLIVYQIRYVPTPDILAHRIFWGLSTLLLWLAFQGRLRELAGHLRQVKIVAPLAVAALMLVSSWAAFTWAASNEQALQAGLGYFISPLVSIAFGAWINHEKLDPMQIVAIGVATMGVLILTIGLGEIPTISLIIAFSFAGYGLIKSRVKVGAVMSVTIENILLLPIALIWLLGFAQYGLNFGGNASAAPYLIIGGVFTALALIGFSYATKTIGLVATGMLCFIDPTLQVVNAAFILGEPLTIWHKIAFPIIWLACGIYCYDLWQSGRKRAVAKQAPQAQP